MKLRRRVLTPSLWDLTESFYLAFQAYDEVHGLYESRVLAHARERGVDRRALRLDAETVSKLLDLGKLESLRNGPLHEVKDVAHVLFRRKATTDKLDRYVSEIFHELSILKEEQYKVTTFAPEYRKGNELEEYESLLDEVHQEFPRKVHNIRDLFHKARWRLEAILRKQREDVVFARSLALFGEKLLEKCYPAGVLDFMTAIYPCGSLEGNVVAARSFARGGFVVQARAAAKRALEAVVRGRPEGIPLTDWQRLAEEAGRLSTDLEKSTATELVRAFAVAEAPKPPSGIGLVGEEELPPGSADDVDDVDLTPARGTPIPREPR
ncbi:MAG TPA: hypothetical protein VFF73_31990 [Planctomycetota bacterium]|nr:hypothetical protein [Planctomycetota bacterium]